MDDLLPLLLSFPVHPAPLHSPSDRQYDESIRLQVRDIRRLPTKALLQSTSGGEDILNIINPALNSVPYAFALLARIRDSQNSTKSDPNRDLSASLAPLWGNIVLFLENFDVRQVRYIGSETTEIITVLAALAYHLKQLGAAVAIIANVIVRLDPAASTLTSAHLLLCRLTLESGEYSQATPVISRHVLYTPPVDCQSKFLCSSDLSPHQYLTTKSGLTKPISSQDILEYFLYSSSIFIGQKQWENAAECLENVITYPVKDNAVSKIMIEAYKKWTLVKVLLTGKSPSLPQNTNNNASKAFRVVGKPYDVVANLFELGSASRLNAEISAGMEIWEKDGNSGLMRAILGSYQRHQIRKLSSLYETIPVSYISQTTVSAETGVHLESHKAVEDLLNEMISRRELHGAFVGTQVNQSTFLGFSPTGRVSTETDVGRELANAMTRIKYMIEDIKTTDHLLTHEKEYLRWVRKHNKLGEATSGDGYVGEELGWIVGPDDEDLMALQ